MSKDKLAQVFHFDLYGKREDKYDFLREKSLKDIDWNKLESSEPNYFLVKKNFEGENEYATGIKMDEIFIRGAGGIASHRDSFVIDYNIDHLKQRITDFYSLSKEELKSKYKLIDTKEWQIDYAKKVKQNENKYSYISYRPFDIRSIYFEDSLITRSRRGLMKHFLKDNLGLVTCKRQENQTTVLVTKHLIDQRYFSVPGAVGKDYAFPLYLYPETNAQAITEETPIRIANLNVEFIKQIADKLAIKFTNERENTINTFAPIDILDYIYAVLHSPTYRKKYKEFLKIDFPRVPYPEDTTTFWELVRLGRELRQIHLLESPVVEKFITKYPVDGNNVVSKIKYYDNQVFINDTQYFDGVPQIAWEFYIGGYQPAQKWLKDRKSRELNFKDILHYQKIIVALSETDRIMKEIDKIKIA